MIDILRLTAFIILTALIASVHFFSPATAFAGPGAGFVKLDLLPEFLDPYDLYFNFTFIRYMRPGEPFEIPRSRFNELFAAGPGKVPDKIKSIKITMNKNDQDGAWFSFFDPFYRGRTIVCDYDRSRNLVGALMIDTSGEVCIRSACAYDEAGRLTGETSEVFDRIFGRDGSGGIDDRRPRTGETIFRREVKHVYSKKGRLEKSEYKSLKTDGWFDYSYDPEGRLATLECHVKDLDKPYYIFEYSYTGSGRLAGVKWHNGTTNALEMYYDYVYDENGNCVKIKCPVFLAPDRNDGKLLNEFKYDDKNRLTGGVYYNWFINEPDKPDSIIRCSYGDNGFLSEIQVEPAKMNPGKKYSFRYSYEFFQD